MTAHASRYGTQQARKMGMAPGRHSPPFSPLSPYWIAETDEGPLSAPESACRTVRRAPTHDRSVTP